MSRAGRRPVAGGIVGSLSSSIPKLIRDELELLRAQLLFVLARLQAASVLLVVAIALVMATVILLVGAPVAGLATCLIDFGSEPAAAVAISALLVAVASGVFAAALSLGANTQFRRAQAAVDQSVDAVKTTGRRESRS